jgi:hypothetical protein
MRHKRSQNAGVLYVLAEEVMGVADALIRISPSVNKFQTRHRWAIRCDDQNQTMRVRSVLLHDGIDERVTQHRRLLQSLITPQSSSLCHCHDGA